MFEPKPTDEVTHAIVGAAIVVHDAFGPGLFEKAYIMPFVWELQERGLQCATRVPIDLTYKGRRLKQAYFIDTLVEDRVVVEVKSVERLAPVHLAQTITLRASRGQAGWPPDQLQREATGRRRPAGPERQTNQTKLRDLRAL